MNLRTDTRVLLGPSSFGAEDASPLETLARHVQVIENPYKRKLTRAELQTLLAQDVVGLIAGLEILDREVLAHSKLKVISRCGAGMSNIDLAAAKEFGIRVYSTPYGPTRAVAELTIGCLMALLRQVPQMNDALHAGRWDKRVGRQLHGMTAVLVGFGRIGRMVGELLHALGVEILVCDPAYEHDVAYAKPVTLADALPMVDILSLHCGGETQMIGEHELSRVKVGAYLLNAARGGLIDEAALCRALDTGRLAGAWIDTFVQEPYQGPLARYPQVMLTPHVGSYTREGRLQMEIDAVHNLLQGLSLMEPL